MDLVKALKIYASGLRAQTMCMRVSAENMANADSMGAGAGSESSSCLCSTAPNWYAACARPTRA